MPSVAPGRKRHPGPSFRQLARLVVKATQQGDLLGVPASGTAIQWNAVDIYRIRDGRISEEWAADDIAAIMSQLGAFSPPWLG